jgi:hypothetical protein
LVLTVAAHDHEDVAPREDGPDLGQPDGFEKEVLLVDHVLERVLGKRLEGVGNVALACVEPLLRLGEGDHLSLGNHFVASIDLSFFDPYPIAVPDRLEDVGPRLFDQENAGPAQHQGSQVRVAAGAERGSVDDGLDLFFDEPLGGHAVEVLMIDDHDLAGLNLANELFGSSSQANRAFEC